MLAIKPFIGQHCETTTSGTLLYQQGIELSEPLLFGLGEGLSFIFWHMNSMPMPFIGGRVKPDQLTETLAKQLNLKLERQETSSSTKAWAIVKDLLDQGQVVGLKLDCFYLEYFSNPIHFAGHYVAIYGYDHDHAYLVDTHQQGSIVQTSLASLAQARAAKGSMASKSMAYTLKPQGSYDLAQAVRQAIINNAQAYLNPPITNVNYKGIRKASAALQPWFEASANIEYDFCTTALLMERAGTGGSLFRKLYRDFLAEASTIIAAPQLRQAEPTFTTISENWQEVANLLDQAGKQHDLGAIQKASRLMNQIAEQEYTAMHLLATL
ncbi:MAG TPA: DUF4872 domain-containing protein [Herpetosiphon sp.]|uniref:Lantibiotic ABC transporter n=1 Tax=Herpetosiphon aurantiacus (strain ATCC 23779 / DSM 785 / 114-95) TaxID=316274 RepID=A9B5C5_HERA2|nr:BtrH N-terminal domain-containing protein [Herpetosiphon sp.]ABX02750.1 conserved hypothetical protein [Herpetosiphon aurantiacus DSM 785]HBW49127.1 DUF4872 domain-containing protein [Herpetosiphon sp.]